MQTKTVLSIAGLALVCGWGQSAFAARDQIRIAGSGTVYPFVTEVAEQFGQGGTFKTPIVEATGTGGGFKLFCEGVDEATTDINNASRKMTDSEKQLCDKNGVTDAIEIPIGYDGIVIGSKKGAAIHELSKKQLFLALARELPGKDGKMAPNPNKTWKDVDAGLPDQAIKVYGPPPSSGTRDTFVELVMEKGCEQEGSLAKVISDDAARKKACQLLREDGGYVEAGEDYNMVIQKLNADDKALGIVGYNFYEQNTSKIQATSIEGVLPASEAIVAGKYGISRGLYVYLKKQHLGVVPGIVEFARELTSEAAVGANGYLTAKGLLPLKEEDRKAARDKVKALAKP